MKKVFNCSSLLLLALICGCSNNKSSAPTDSAVLPSTPSEANGVTYMRAKAEFDVTTSPSGSAKYELVKTSYASNNCVNNICSDVSDVSVTNNPLTQFSLSANQTRNVSQNTSNAQVNLVTLLVGTLFDNTLNDCGGLRCLGGAIRVYTTDNGGPATGPGLYNSATGRSVALMVSGGTLSSAVAIPYKPSDSSLLIIDQEPIVTGQELISLANGDFPNSVSPGYQINADFSQAGAGNYSAHVVVEYDLIGPPSLALTRTDNQIGYPGDQFSFSVTKKTDGSPAPGPLAFLVNGQQAIDFNNCGLNNTSICYDYYPADFSSFYGTIEVPVSGDIVYTLGSTPGNVVVTAIDSTSSKGTLDVMIQSLPTNLAILQHLTTVDSMSYNQDLGTIVGITDDRQLGYFNSYLYGDPDTGDQSVIQSALVSAVKFNDGSYHIILDQGYGPTGGIETIQLVFGETNAITVQMLNINVNPAILHSGTAYVVAEGNIKCNVGIKANYIAPQSGNVIVSNNQIIYTPTQNGANDNFGYYTTCLEFGGFFSNPNEILMAVDIQ